MQLRKGLAEISISQESFYLTAPSKLPHVPVVILLVPDAQKVPKKQIIHGMHPVGRKVQSIDLKMLL